MKTPNDNLLLIEKDSLGNYVKQEKTGSVKLKNPYYNFDSAEGINYIIDVSKPAGERVNILSLSNGQPFDLNRIYKVAMNSYRANGGGGHLTAGAKIRSELLKDRILTSTDKDFRFQLMKWLEKNKEITIKSTNNWTIIPEKWYAKARERDFGLLFPGK
jgi:2',3'-cyclic-nucleotide 2'-phosphodiesterase/3'-nucleotidase